MRTLTLTLVASTLLLNIACSSDAGASASTGAKSSLYQCLAQHRPDVVKLYTDNGWNAGDSERIFKDWWKLDRALSKDASVNFATPEAYAQSLGCK